MTQPRVPTDMYLLTSAYVSPGVLRVRVNDGDCWLEAGPLQITFRYPHDHEMADKPRDYALWMELGRLQRQIEAMWDARDDAREATDAA